MKTCHLKSCDVSGRPRGVHVSVSKTSLLCQGRGAPARAAKAGQTTRAPIAAPSRCDLAAPLRKAATDRLNILEASTRAAWGATLHHSRLGCEPLLAGAAALAEAHALCPPEAWGEWLKGLRILGAIERILDLHRIALDTQELEDLGGVAPTVMWAAEARLPNKGTVLAVTLGDWQPGRVLPVAYVWQAPGRPGHYCAGRIDLAGPPELSRVMRAPLAVERDIWATVWHLLDHRFGDVVFRTVRDASLVERLEERRQSILKAGMHRVH